jgi:putative addiction module component (TIGR02574 family)
MNLALEHWKSQLIALSPSERVELAHFLLTSLYPTEEGVESAWDSEASRRVEEIQSGGAEGRPVAEVIADLRERYP